MKRKNPSSVISQDQIKIFSSTTDFSQTR